MATNAVTEIVRNRLPHLEAECPTYWSAFEQAWLAHPPPYGEAWYGVLFREKAIDLDWLAGIIALNSRKEADGARQLWAFARRICDDDIRPQVRQHAIDEARHAAFYIAMLDLIFPGAFAAQDMARLRSNVPRFDRDDDNLDADHLASTDAIIDEIVQMNIGEVRTLINQMLMRPFVACLTPDENRERALKLIDGLGDDEAVHIEYTARLIEGFGDRERVAHFAALRLEEFNGITRREVGTAEGVREVFA